MPQEGERGVKDEFNESLRAGLKFGCKVGEIDPLSTGVGESRNAVVK